MARRKTNSRNTRSDRLAEQDYLRKQYERYRQQWGRKADQRTAAEYYQDYYTPYHFDSIIAYSRNIPRHRKRRNKHRTLFEQYRDRKISRLESLINPLNYFKKLSPCHQAKKARRHMYFRHLAKGGSGSGRRRVRKWCG